MDEIDLKILRILRENSRESLAVIAEKVGTSKATVSRRITKLEKDGLISSYTLTTNSTKLGLMRAMIGIELAGSSLEQAIEELRNFEEIQAIYKVFGDHSLLCEIYARSVDSLYELIQSKILKIPGILNVEVDIFIEKIVLNPDAELDILAKKTERSTKDF
jgi:DNA-binding Lrp family transcriptional regulator